MRCRACGVGLHPVELLSLMEFDQTVLQEGIVLAIELGHDLAPRKMMLHKEKVVFCVDGVELIICSAPSDIPIL